jgi:hypothetical protein
LVKRHLNGVSLGQQQDNSQASNRQSRDREHAGKLTKGMREGSVKWLFRLDLDLN